MKEQHPKGAKVALTVDQISDFLYLSGTIDWEESEHTTVRMLRAKYGWKILSDQLLEKSDGIILGVEGSSRTTYALTTMHTICDKSYPDIDIKSLEHLEEVRQIVSRIFHLPARVGTRHDGNGYVWDLSDGRRVWANTTSIEVLSPNAATAERWTQENPEKYASYGNEGDTA